MLDYKVFSFSNNKLGLGFSIVKTILSLYQSKLEIESKVDKESTFSFKI